MLDALDNWRKLLAWGRKEMAKPRESDPVRVVVHIRLWNMIVADYEKRRRES